MARILVVDDSPTETHQMVNTLARQGHQVLTATTGSDGVAMASVEQPDVILMDVVMPGMNGFQATRRLTKDPKTSDIPVIMITTKDQETDKIWGMRQGAVEYLVKPVAEKELVAMIDSVMAD